MSSIAVSLVLLGLAIASLLASLILNTVECITKHGGKEGWITTNINRGRYDDYYWVLAIMSLVNMFYYVACSWAYGRCADEMAKNKPETSDVTIDPVEKLQRARSITDEK